MNIFLSCQQSLKRHNVPAYMFWETYFKQGLEEAGHKWTEAQEIDWAEGLVYLNQHDLRSWRDRIWNQTINFIKQEHQIQPIDLFLSYLFPKQVEPDAIRQIQALGIPCVNFFCDNVRELTKVPKEFSCFNLHWVPEFKALKMYRKAGLAYIHAPMPVWIAPQQRTYQHSENFGVSFIGSRDTQREQLLAKVLQAGCPIEIRGAGWGKGYASKPLTQHQSLLQTGLNQWDMIARQGFKPWMRKLQFKTIPKIADDIFQNFVQPQPDASEYIKVIQESMITLGINRYPSFRYSFYQPDTYSRMRDIEAPMMGACYLTEWTEGLDELYEIGEEIETYRTDEEMIEKIQRIKSCSETRKKLRYKGQQRALSHHTVANSINRIATSLGLSK